LKLALDATYSLGNNLSGVGIYSRELLRALAASHPEQQFTWSYRPHRYLKSFHERLPGNAGRGLLLESFGFRRGLFHGLNQRVPLRRFARQVVTFHDLFVMTAEYSTPEFRERFIGQARHAAAEADRIIAVSQFTATQVESLLGVDPSRIHVVHHGIRPLPVVARAPEKIVLHVGAIQERKNVTRLVRAFAALPEGWKLVLAGSTGYGAAGIFQEIESSARRNDIIITGYISELELAAWYSRASVFAFPSLDEGFGMPVLEAMRAGVAVIASNRSAVPEVCGEAALLVDATDLDGLATGLKKLASNPDVRSELEQWGRARAEQFSWERAAAATWRVYQEALS
jgi:glycosyltransferase involved in cell wall biosynthesis